MRDHELEDQADSAGYGGATEGVGQETPPQEQQQPHLQDAQHRDAEEGESAPEAEPGDGGSRDETV
jgi:hypothetical protein